MVKKVLPLIFLLVFPILQSGAQIPGVEGLFKADELLYFSDLESGSFRDFLDGKPDYLAMIAAVNPNTSKRELELYRTWIVEIMEECRGKRFDKLSEARKIDRIQKFVSKALLLSYVYEADFEDLFRFGKYNYFTAAAIYAFVLDQFGIPYEIREVPTHLYILAFPGDRNIHLETTRPGQQYFMFDHETRSEFVKFLLDQGVVDDRTFRNTSTRDLFEQYYVARYGLSIREMIGMLYINSALDLMSQNRSQQAYAQLEKAFILYPSYKTQYLLLVELNRHLVGLDYHNLADLGYLIKASRLVDHGISRELLQGILSDLVYTILVREEDQEGFVYIYDYLMQYLGDEELKKKFNFLFFYEQGRMEFNQTRYGNALNYLESACRIYPEHEKAENLLTRALGGYSLTVGPRPILEKIRLYDTTYSGIQEEGIYILVKIRTFLALSGESFQLHDAASGEKYMKEFESLMKANPEAEVDQILVGRTYSSAAIHYYRNGQIRQSRQMIEKGLEYAPDNIELKLKLKSFN